MQMSGFSPPFSPQTASNSKKQLGAADWNVGKTERREQVGNTFQTGLLC